jgi:hypothetical protein
MHMEATPIANKKKADKKYEPQRLMLQKRKGKRVLHTQYKDMVLEGRNTLCD